METETHIAIEWAAAIKESREFLNEIDTHKHSPKVGRKKKGNNKVVHGFIVMRF